LGGEGAGCEPASAATLAGLKKLVRSGFVREGETAVLVLTGHMLKDVDSMVSDRASRDTLEPDVAAVIHRLEQIDAC
jgi:threonine synthase